MMRPDKFMKETMWLLHLSKTQSLGDLSRNRILQTHSLTGTNSVKWLWNMGSDTANEIIP